MKVLNVLYVTTPNYMIYTMASICSLIYNSRMDKIICHLITDGFTQKDEDMVKKTFENYDNIDFYFYDLGKFSIENYHIPNWKQSQIANAKIFFGSIMENNLDSIDQLLYLDSDTIVIDSLEELQQYTNGFYAVNDLPIIKGERQEIPEREYFNSGVMWIDRNNWIENDYEKRCIDIVKKRNVEFKYPDQDILNLALLGEVNELPLSYNIPPYLYILNNYLEKIYLKGRCYTAQDFQLARNSAKILHSYGLCGIKPWCENKVNPFNEEFCKYLQFVDSDFCKEKLDLKLKLLTIHPNLFYLAFISLRFVPREINDRLRLLLK